MPQEKDTSYSAIKRDQCRAPQKKNIHENVNVSVPVSQAAEGSHNRRTKIAVYHVIQCEMKRSKKCKRQERMLLSYLQCGKLHLVHW